jgi:hypothetical protein
MTRRNDSKSSITAFKKNKEMIETSRNLVKFEVNNNGKHNTTGIVINRISNSTIVPNNTNITTLRGTGTSFLNDGASPDKKLNKRGSFSLENTTYLDARTSWHPLRDSKTPILNDLATIEKMKKANRYPVPEKILHKPDDF